MRYAIFSDIHSNLEAYDAVLEAIAKEKVDGYYCCGDIVGYGADPATCIIKTRVLNPYIVAGNHDWGSVGLADLANFTDNARAAVLWTAGVLCEEDKRYLMSLQLTYKTDPSPLPLPKGERVRVRGLGDFLMVHGSPNRPEEFEYIFGLNDAYTAFLRMEEIKTRICFIGHTHAAGVFIEDLGYVTYNPGLETRLIPEKKYIINVGSVGQPRDNDPRAAYCIYDTEEKIIRIKRVDYDIETTKDKIIKVGLPRILAERLSIGR